jgi:predicted HicB family RNase H-like nuclease
MLKYKGYIGLAVPNQLTDGWRGKLINVSDLVTYESDSLKGLSIEFQAAVDDYIKTKSEIKNE